MMTSRGIQSTLLVAAVALLVAMPSAAVAQGGVVVQIVLTDVTPSLRVYAKLLVESDDFIEYVTSDLPLVDAEQIRTWVNQADPTFSAEQLSEGGDMIAFRVELTEDDEESIVLSEALCREFHDKMRDEYRRGVRWGIEEKTDQREELRMELEGVRSSIEAHLRGYHVADLREHESATHEALTRLTQAEIETKQSLRTHRAELSALMAAVEDSAPEGAPGLAEALRDDRVLAAMEEALGELTVKVALDEGNPVELTAQIEALAEAIEARRGQVSETHLRRLIADLGHRTAIEAEALAALQEEIELLEDDLLELRLVTATLRQLRPREEHLAEQVAAMDAAIRRAQLAWE
ncbi:MAG: hypothetical protein ACYTFO_08905, partial [Planctomycetota bacterium]